jgi:hypothetical protein
MDPLLLAPFAAALAEAAAPTAAEEASAIMLEYEGLLKMLE